MDNKTHGFILEQMWETETSNKANDIQQSPLHLVWTRGGQESSNILSNTWIKLSQFSAAVQ